MGVTVSEEPWAAGSRSAHQEGRKELCPQHRGFLGHPMALGEWGHLRVA